MKTVFLYNKTMECPETQNYQYNTFESLLTECVYDDIHGFVALTREEKQLINHPYFRRLHFIRQNALANFIFPGATHTRFSHSIGVLFIVEKMVQKLKTLPKWKIDITPFDHQVIRLAALLHDIGHYPLSHTIEECFKQYDEFFIERPEKAYISVDKGDSVQEYKPAAKRRQHFIENIHSGKAKIKNILGDFISEGKYDSLFHHEKIAKALISNKKSPLYMYIGNILKNTYIKINNKNLSNDEMDNYLHLIGQIICGNPRYATNKILLNSDKEKDKYFILSLLLHSDLDADQMDYMLRDTKNTGIQTTIRVDFLINNMDICFQKQRDGYIQPVLCFNYKAFESVQQFIFSKAYWYTEIILYDKVSIINKIAQRLYMYDLIKYRQITSLDDFYNKILFNENNFIKFTDNEFWEKIHNIYETDTTPIIKNMVDILIGEKPIPKAVPIDSLPQIGQNNIFMTSLVPESKTGEQKLKIYSQINNINKSEKLFPIFYSNKFFKKSYGEDSDRYVNRSIYILTSPCSTSEPCAKNCEKVEELLKTNRSGRNIIHKLMYKPGDFYSESGNYEQAYVEKCVVYDFN